MKFDGKVVSMTDAAKPALKKVGKNYTNAQEPMHWLYNGKKLHGLHEQIGG